jgi:hypothetical protein
MHVLDANELFWITSYTYDRIMEEWWKNWPDAFALYFKLMKQARIQQTNQTYTLNEFLRNWMGRWADRLRNAKNILKRLGLVDDINIQDEKGKITWHYVRVNYLIDEDKVRTSSLTYNLSTSCLRRETASSTCGWTDANALNTKIVNAWNTKPKKKNAEIPSIDELVEAYRGDERINEAFLEEDIIEWLKFKRWRKEYYATTKSFLQQMIVIKRMITNGKPQLDIPKRFNFAVNNAIGYGWKWIHRDDNTERQYLASKKDLFKTPNQDE